MAQSLNPTFKKLTAIDIVNVSDFFKQYLTVTNDGAVYADGWDDDRIAKEAIPNYTGDGVATVAKYRISLGYGKLAYTKKVSSEYEELKGMIYCLSENLEDQYNELQTRISLLERSHFAIASAESQLRHMKNG
jgi:hypothetical protein